MIFVFSTDVILQTFSDPVPFETMTIVEKNRVDELNLPVTYITALGDPANISTRPILQIVSAKYKKFSEITDAELVAESLVPYVKLSTLELKVLLRRVYVLYYNK